MRSAPSRRDAVREAVLRADDDLIALSHRIHAHPELSFEEVRACEWVGSALADLGFEVDSGVVDLPTALIARIGRGPLNIGICAEYDALPGLGHACGHNIIAAAAVGAATGLASMIDELGLTITVLGTPAEENGGGKVIMLQRGAFDGLHAALMVHPHATERDAMSTLAESQIDVEFEGVPAHAAAHPERGVNAASALALGQVGIGMLREHMNSADRVHGIVIYGGEASNIVPGHTTGRWSVRSPAATSLDDLQRRFLNVFRGAALMTGCDVRAAKNAPSYTELVTDERIATIWRRNSAALGRTSLPRQQGDAAASTDMGNVSFAMPVIHPLVAVDAHGSDIHEEGFAREAAGASADKAVIDSALMMAWTVIDMALDASLTENLIAHPYEVASVPPASAGYLDYGFGQPM